MALPLLLDSNVLARVVRPHVAENKPVAGAVARLLDNPGFEVLVPEIIDYELRRKLLHLGNDRHHARAWAREALAALDDLVFVGYSPLTTEAMRLAASLWAKTRSTGRPRGAEDRLDVDVILAAQARRIGGQVVTLNEKHFEDLVAVFDLAPYQEAG
jgi:predicted nucleic acid-binding protein